MAGKIETHGFEFRLQPFDRQPLLDGGQRQLVRASLCRGAAEQIVLPRFRFRRGPVRHRQNRFDTFEHLAPVRHDAVKRTGLGEAFERPLVHRPAVHPSREIG